MWNKKLHQELLIKHEEFLTSHQLTKEDLYQLSKHFAHIVDLEWYVNTSVDYDKQLDVKSHLSSSDMAHYVRTIYFRGQLIPLCAQIEQKQWYVIYKEQYYYGEQFDDVLFQLSCIMDQKIYEAALHGYYKKG